MGGIEQVGDTDNVPWTGGKPKYDWGFSSSVVPERWRIFYSLNPIVGVIDGFRWALIGGEVNLYLPGFLLSILFSVILFISGTWFFTKTERKFADII